MARILLPTTFNSRKEESNERKPEQGFSLVELLVVIALIAIIGTMAIPSISNVFKISLGSANRDLATTVRHTYNAALMTKKVHRLVFDLKESRYWVEVGPQNLLLETEESKARSERLRRFGSKDEDEEKKKNDSPFSLATYVTRKKNTLPRGIEIEEVKTEQNKDPIKEGMAYTHFFPHGIVEQSVIHLKDSADHKATLVIEPIVGKTRVYDRFVSIEEALRVE